jgi:hypothetical protein
MTGTEALQAGAVICVISALVLWVMCRCAPYGWEDSDGFHEGHEHSDYTDPNGDR